MQILLDTQAIIRSLEDGNKITSKAQDAMLSADAVFVSPISFYELAIKLRIGRDIGSKRPLDDIITESLASGFQWLPLQRHHVAAYQQILLFDNHRDPFDRMMLAIALAEGLTVVSADHNFPLYNDLVDILW
ncbi:type II toxin-antitoxin system VapC family toxin [Spirosoma agri]|uniref:Type II toxin-antitoxin system VapC family toxin n=1 Tax=Spirosoma agri TaxID=1987381 RepID=A0A6M0INH6_9BACT|nr:type II toxin-antitoxin system VapC family toxin [Spirosoma agri]NEU69788.1 type II toxin-antitoxin system VapC family toxin [Spirosoma agri]